jgi:hypothetical protein
MEQVHFFACTAHFLVYTWAPQGNHSLNLPQSRVESTEKPFTPIVELANLQEVAIAVCHQFSEICAVFCLSLSAAAGCCLL